MSVLKPMYKSSQGKKKKVGRWYVEFKDHTGILRRIPAYSDKGATVTLESKIKKLVSCKNSGQPELVYEASQYFEQLPTSAKETVNLRNHLIAFGLLNAKKTQAGYTSLADYIKDFTEYMKATPNIKDKTYKQARQTATRVRNIINGCGFKTWRDVDADKIQLFLSKLDIKLQTLKFYTKAFERFAKWMVNQGYAVSDSVPELAKVKVPRRPERAFEYNEFAALLEAAATGPERYGLTGYQRRLLYLLAVETGLRRGELSALTPVSFNFRNRSVFVPGDDTKNADHAEQDISPELAEQVQEYCRTKLPSVKLFPIHDKSAKMLQKDCQAADIEVVNIRGKLKFHSLRHSTASFLIAQGANPKVIQEVMRHSSIELTMSRYGHLFKGQKKSAIAGLGRFSVRHAATGTE